ncbi:hypothetical protein C2R22_14240 [Salinigranum rubrum]|uniref:Uncharacterized protein n=1 Tax=Salinigranum rubrum TaxID=755307 RepID=A0A2I8VL50_9EURY|nr:hypothetical protein [Salinigranum rubrum]AUV82656.1 hypothetical protein C2R22_14240 [Salinigranum rubrum]
MVQLRSCYFCGTTGALSEYEALPRTGVPDERMPRVVLCDRCHTKLTNVLAPLVDGVGRTGLGDAVETDHSPMTGTPTGDDTPDSSGGVSERTDSSTQEVTFSASTSASMSASASADAGENVDDTLDAAGGADDSPESASASVGSDEHTATATDERELGDGTETADAPKPDEEATDEGATDDADSEEHVEQGGAEANEPSADLDRVYHKLLRFLRNREFPIPRAEAEAVAQSAYDLSATEASQVVQRAVDRGVLEERDGELHRR